MNPVLELMSDHRSVRAFTDEPVSDEVVRRAVGAAQMAATSSHIQAYAVVRVVDPEVRSELVTLTGGQRYVASCGAFLVIAGDVRRHRLVAERAGVDNVQNLETFLLAVVDASLFAQNLALALESEGLGICYIGGLRNRLPEADRLLGLPDGVWPLYGLCVGVPETRPGKKPRLPIDAVYAVGRYPADESMRRHIEAYDAEMADYYAGRGLDGRTWSGGIERRFAAASRGHLAGFYRAKGARLE